MERFRGQGQADAQADAQGRVGPEDRLLLRRPAVRPALQQAVRQPALAHVVQKRPRSHPDEQFLGHVRPVHEHEGGQHHHGQAVLVFLVALAEEPRQVPGRVLVLEEADGLAHELADLVETGAAYGMGELFLQEAADQGGGAGVPGLGALGQGDGIVEEDFAQDVAEVVFEMPRLPPVDVGGRHAHGPKPPRLLRGEGRAPRGVKDKPRPLANINREAPRAPWPQEVGAHREVGLEIPGRRVVPGRRPVAHGRPASPGAASQRGRRISTTSSS